MDRHHSENDILSCSDDCMMSHEVYKERVRDRRTNRVILLLALVIASLVTGMVSWQLRVHAEKETQEHLAEEVLRFHILANSDSEEDQDLKMKVKEEVLGYLDENMPEGMDVTETTEWMRYHTDELEDLSREIVIRAGYDYPVSVAVTTCWFPEKSYGDLTFPAGNYQALRIEIGAAKGHNWWCVLYPNLCFLDAINAVVPEEGKQELKNVLSEEEYSRITATTDFKIKWYFPEFLR